VITLNFERLNPFVKLRGGPLNRRVADGAALQADTQLIENRDASIRGHTTPQCSRKKIRKILIGMFVPLDTCLLTGDPLPGLNSIAALQRNRRQPPRR
jgi:hypothetical protein